MTSRSTAGPVMNSTKVPDQYRSRRRKDNQPCAETRRLEADCGRHEQQRRDVGVHAMKKRSRDCTTARQIGHVVTDSAHSWQQHTCPAKASTQATKQQRTSQRKGARCRVGRSHRKARSGSPFGCPSKLCRKRTGREWIRRREHIRLSNRQAEALHRRAAGRMRTH